MSLSGLLRCFRSFKYILSPTCALAQFEHSPIPRQLCSVQTRERRVGLDQISGIRVVLRRLRRPVARITPVAVDTCRQGTTCHKRWDGDSKNFEVLRLENDHDDN